MEATVDERGRILIPKELREKFHLAPGSVVHIQELQGGMQVIADRRKAASAHLQELFELARKAKRRKDAPPFDPRETKKIWERKI